MEIYAPLANRLGIWQIKWELEDLAFRYLEPEKYREIAELLAVEARQRASATSRRSTDVLQRAARRGRASRPRSPAARSTSTASTRRCSATPSRAKSFDQIYDLLALRVLVDDVGECYNALGIVHALWHPIPGQFDDYIANPKENCTSRCTPRSWRPSGRPLEMQIRTTRCTASPSTASPRTGATRKAASRPASDEERIAWLRQLLDWQRDLAGAEEFVESVKTDIFHDQVFVYTPKGDVLGPARRRDAARLRLPHPHRPRPPTRRRARSTAAWCR